MGTIAIPFATATTSATAAAAVEAAAGTGAGGASDRLDPDAAFGWEDDTAAGIDVQALWAAVYRNRYVMLAILAGTILLGVASILFMPRIYQARASVQIDQQVAKVLGTEDADPFGSSGEAERFLQTQVDVLTSRAMALHVAESLGLTANDTFLKRMSGADTLPPAGPSGGSRQDRVLDALQNHLSVELRRNSRVVGVTFTSRDPALAADIANSYSTNFIEQNIQRKFSTSAYSRKFLNQQLGLAKGRLEDSERGLIAYARSARLIDASAGAAHQAGAPDGPRSLVTSNLVDLNTAYAESEANRLRARQRWEQARATPLMSLPEVLANEAVQRLTQKRAEDVASLNQLRNRLKPDHPTIIQASAELTTIDQQINALARSIRESIASQSQTADRQTLALERKLNSLKDATLTEQGRGVQYNILQREVDTNRQLYESLLQRFKQVSAEAGVTTNNVAIIDTAELPRKPTSPRPLLNLLLSGVIGLIFAGLYAFAREHLDDAIRDPQDVERKLGLPLLGVVPDQTDGAPLVALRDPRSVLAEAYHSVRTAIELSSNQGVPRSILITGAGQSEGKSTTSFALAQDFAKLGRRVLLIDADLRRPSLHRVIKGKRTERGLSTVLARLAPVEAAIVETETPNLSFLSSGPVPPDPASLFAGTALAELLAQLVAQFDLVVIDGPPVLALADATQLAAAAQATIFVVAAGGAHFGHARNAVSRLIRAGANLTGCVVTRYNARKMGYGGSQVYYQYHYAEPAATA